MGAHGPREREKEREKERERECLPMLISAAGPLVLFSMQLGWMREPGFQHTPIGINLAMLEAANTATIPLGHSMPSRLCLHTHAHRRTHMLTNKLLLCGVVCSD